MSSLLKTSQIDLFEEPNNEQRISIVAGWFIVPDQSTTAENQELVFDVQGAKAQHHTGQKSVWIINGIDKSVFYSNGDPYRVPSKDIIDRASNILINLTKAKKLFPSPLESVIYSNAWSKGAQCGFNNESSSNNLYPKGSVEYNAWFAGWNENS